MWIGEWYVCVLVDVMVAGWRIEMDYVVFFIMRESRIRYSDVFFFFCSFFFQAEDGIRDLVRSRGLGDVYKRQPHHRSS